MMTYSAPASAIIAADTSPVNAPSRSQCMSCAATPTLLLRAASATAWIAVNGGPTTISTSAMSLTTARSSLTNTTASWTVLNIFQLPAIRGVRMFISWQVRRVGCALPDLPVPPVRLGLRQRGDAGQHAPAEKFE